jgi:hypothetical protein
MTSENQVETTPYFFGSASACSVMKRRAYEGVFFLLTHAVIEQGCERQLIGLFMGKEFLENLSAWEETQVPHNGKHPNPYASMPCEAWRQLFPAGTV